MTYGDALLNAIELIADANSEMTDEQNKAMCVDETLETLMEMRSHLQVSSKDNEVNTQWLNFGRL